MVELFSAVRGAVTAVALVIAPGSAAAQSAPSGSDSGPEGERGVISSEQASLYRIGPGDILRIVVYGEPDLTMTVPVRPDGRFSMPLLEDLEAADKTPSQLADDIEQGLDEFLRTPSVTVEVQQAVGAFDQQIRVVGTAIGEEVGGTGAGAVAERFPVAPRAIPYQEGITLLDVVTELGLSPFASSSGAVIIRTAEGERQEIPVRLDDLVEDGDMSANMPMAPGDVLLIPQGFFAGDWETATLAGAFVTFTDNVDLETEELATSALIMTLAPGFSIRATTPRIYGGFDGTFNLEYRELLEDSQTGVDEGFDPFVTFLGTAAIEAVPDFLFIDTSGSITQQSTGGVGEATSTSEFVQTNRQSVVAFRFSPYIPVHLGRSADAQFRYSFGTAFESGDENSQNPFAAFVDRADQTIINSLGFSVSSGPDTSQYGAWTFLTSASRETRDQEDDADQAQVELTWAYPLNHSLFALAAVGWDYFDDGIPENEVSAPSFAGGVRWTPSPRLNLTATAGQKYDRLSVFLNADWALSAKTRFFASLEDGLTSGTQAVLRSTSFLEIDPETGQFIDERTGTTFNPAFPGTIDDNTTFIRDFVIGGSTIQGRSVYGFQARYFTETQEPDGDKETQYTIATTWSRQISLRTSARLAAVYQRNSLTDRDDNTYTVTGGLNYEIYKTIAATLSYGYQRRDSTSELAEFTENVITVGVRGSF